MWSKTSHVFDVERSEVPKKPQELSECNVYHVFDVERHELSKTSDVFDVERSEPSKMSHVVDVEEVPTTQSVRPTFSTSNAVSCRRR